MAKPTTFQQLGNLWLRKTGGHLRERSREAYENAITEASLTIISLNGQLPEQLERWAHNRRISVSSASFTLELGIVKSVLRWGKANLRAPREYAGWDEIKPGAIQNKTFAIPTREQFDAIVENIRNQPQGQFSSDMVEFLGTSGCRKGEAMALQWRDVDFIAGNLLIGRDGNSKTHRSRTIPLFDRLRACLVRVSKYSTVEQDNRVFGEHRLEYRLGIAYRQLGLPHYRIHDFRHYACVEWLRQVGIENAIISSQWAGHRPDQHLNRYANHISNSKSNELAKLIK